MVEGKRKCASLLFLINKSLKWEKSCRGMFGNPMFSVLCSDDCTCNGKCTKHPVSTQTGADIPAFRL